MDCAAFQRWGGLCVDETSASDAGRENARVGSRLRQARESCLPDDGARPTQKWLGSVALPVRTSQQISRFESGLDLPAVSALVEIYHAVRGSATLNDPESAELARWLVDWIADRLERDGALRSDIVSEAVQLLHHAIPNSGTEATSAGSLASLADFPGDGPLTIILADRRESRARTAADCFIYSGSTTDVMYLPYLHRHMDRAIVRSDKLLVRMPDDYLASMPELAESNLLIVGSPAVNWGARILNKKDALFSFRIDDDIVARDERFRTDERMRDPTFASIFWDLARGATPIAGDIAVNEDVIRDRVSKEGKDERLVSGAAKLVKEVLNGSSAKTVMNRFRSLGILDIADQENHAQITYDSNDFALVTLSRNPWSHDGTHRAVICGGIHGPGTASAMRELFMRPERFQDHPLGAVLEVNLQPDLDWPTRFEKATVSFQTGEYSSADVLGHLRSASSLSPEDRKPFYKLMSDDGLKARTDFVGEIVD